jgi:hypothetical protein
MVDIGPDLNLSMILKSRIIVNARYFPYWSWYAQNTSNRTWNSILAITAYSYLGSFNFKYSYEVFNITERPTSEFSWRIWYRQEGHHVSIDYGSHNTFYVNLFGSQKKITYKDQRYLESDEVPHLLNRQETSVGVGLNKIIFSKTRLFLNYQYSDYKFLEQDERNGTGQQLYVGVGFPKKGKITGSFRIGYRTYNPYNFGFESYAKPFGSGQCKVILFHRMRLSLQYVVDSFFSFYGDNVYFDERRLRTGLEYYFTRKFKIGYFNTVGTIDYRFLDEKRKWREGDITSHIFILAYRFFKNLGIGLMYQLYEMDYTDPSLNRSYIFIGGNLIYDF